MLPFTTHVTATVAIYAYSFTSVTEVHAESQVDTSYYDNFVTFLS